MVVGAFAGAGSEGVGFTEGVAAAVRTFIFGAGRGARGAEEPEVKWSVPAPMLTSFEGVNSTSIGAEADRGGTTRTATVRARKRRQAWKTREMPAGLV